MKKTAYFLSLIFLINVSYGCIDDATDSANLKNFQKTIAESEPQIRANEGMDALIPPENPNIQPLEISHNENPQKKTVHLSLEDAILRLIANSPEIKIVSYDPSIAYEDINKSLANFDVTFFTSSEYTLEDNPIDNATEIGKLEDNVLDIGIRQKSHSGAEWTFAYGFSRNWNDLTSRNISTQYNPSLLFQIKQPLLKDGGLRVNLAGVNVSKLNYQIAFSNFRRKTENISTEFISLYWTLLRARKDVTIQEELLAKTQQTYQRLYDRRDIDATAVQIKQAETSLKNREATLLQVEKDLEDIQDSVLRLLSDKQFNLTEDIDIIPSSNLFVESQELNPEELVTIALKNNPEIKQAELEVDIADINLKLARKQKMPRLDFIVSAKMQGLADESYRANSNMIDTSHTNYTVGLSFEYPLGNREARAELRQRKYEKNKAITTFQNVSDLLAAQVKERVRSAEKAFKEIDIQKQAEEAAKIHLQTLEDMETVRSKLTPEFLFVKLQAQETYANAQRATVQAMVDYNIALTRLKQSAGVILELSSVKDALESTVAKQP